MPTVRRRCERAGSHACGLRSSDTRDPTVAPWFGDGRRNPMGLTWRLAPANDLSGYQSDVSGDDRYIAFNSGASNLVPGDTNNTVDVFIHDRG